MRLYKYARMRYTSWLTPSSHAATGTEAGSSGTWRALNPSCIQVSPSFRLVTFSAQRKAPLFSKVFAAWSYTEGNSSIFFYFLSFPLIPFLPFRSCLAGGHWYLFWPGIKVMGEGWLSVAYPAVALFWLVNGVRHGIRTKRWSYLCVWRIKGPKSITNSRRSQYIYKQTSFLLIDYLIQHSERRRGYFCLASYSSSTGWLTQC